MNIKTRNLLIGAALTGLTLSVSGCPSEPANASEGQCHGVNACKGQGDCGNKEHSCGGKNACKGQGWTKSTPEDCQTKGGQFMPAGSTDAPAAKTDAAPAGQKPAEHKKDGH